MTTLLQKLREWFAPPPSTTRQAPKPPAAEPLGLHGALIDTLIAPPAARQEQFADQHEQEVISAQRSLYNRVVATNNRNVTRDYGTHVEEVVSVGGKYENELDATEDDYTALVTKYDGKVLSLSDHAAKSRTLIPKAPVAPAKPVAVLQLGDFGRSRFE